jgi:6-phosphofructokinase 2
VVRELGAMTVAVYPEGGATGPLLTQRLSTRGISSGAVPTRGRTRVCFNASESSTGREFRFILPGVRLESDELAACLDRVEAELAGADVLVASGSLPPGAPEDTYAKLTRRARARGVRVVLDTSGPALRLALGTGLLLVKPSRREMAEALGEPLQDLRSLAAACRKVQSAGAAEVLAVSMGSEGAILTASSGQWLGVPPKVDARSAVGAGDSFVAAMTLSLLRGEPPEVALAWASAAGAAALLAPGTDLASRADVERLRPQVKVTPVD